jgi:molybdopterin molybdotransferase
MAEDTESTLLSVAEARTEILRHFSQVGVASVRLEQALRRVLAEEVTASYDFPRFDNSSVDGFALRLVDHTIESDQPVRFQVVGDIPAGSTKRIRLKPGQAARIMTGAPVPAGADRVAPVEDTDFPYRDPSAPLPEIVALNRIPSRGANIRPRGQDFTKGTMLFHPKRQLSPADIGLLAMMGVKQVLVYRQPRIAIFSSGDELISPGRRLSRGRIFDSNSSMLQALVEDSGCTPCRLGIARDRPESIQALFDRAMKIKADLILTTAGVSVGAFDYVRKILEVHGELKIWRVNMRPGKPLTFGFYGSIPVISLPGNPVSAFVGFLVFVRPILRKMRGLDPLLTRTIRARLDTPVESDGRETYLRAVVRIQSGVNTAALSGHQGSGNLYALSGANALLILPSGVQSLPAGAEVDAWLLSDVME